MACIICGKEETDAPEEHIVPHSLGNEIYVLRPGLLCREHNTLFSKFEEKALTKTILGMERARLGVRTKKGKPAKSKTGKIEFTGDQQFRKNYINIKGLAKEDLIDFDPATGIGKIHVQGFDKTEIPTAKLMLKVGLESVCQSKQSLYKSVSFAELMEYLTNKSNVDWPFLITKSHHSKFESIPTHTEKHALKKNRCELLISTVDEQTLLFNFRYGGVSIIINLLGRKLGWVTEYIEADDRCELFPVHLRKKIN